MMDPADIMSASEVKELLRITDKSDKTLSRCREKWIEGIHFVRPFQRILYIKPMILDWILNSKADPDGHRRAQESWLKKNQTPKSPGRKAS